MGKGFLKYDSQNPPKVKIGRLIFINVFYCLTDNGFFFYSGKISHRLGKYSQSIYIYNEKLVFRMYE